MSRPNPRLGTLVSLLLMACPVASNAALCASDDVPAGSLLFPFLTGSYDVGSTSQHPMADRSKPHTLFSITNVSSTARIVHLQLSNDFGFPLLGWDVVLSGYDTVSFSFADLMEGKLVPTGIGSVPPVDHSIEPWGPAGTYQPGVPKLPRPGDAGRIPDGLESVFGLCTNSVYTAPTGLSPASGEVPIYLKDGIFRGLRRSQVIAENGWYLNQWLPDDEVFFFTPEWLTWRATGEPVWAFLTADVVSACGGSGPWEGRAYFGKYARPLSGSRYAGDSNAGLAVGLGNTLIGQSTLVDPVTDRIETVNAVAIEIDHQDVPNRTGVAIREGHSFYRYGGPGCPAGVFDWEPSGCNDTVTGTGTGADQTRAAPRFQGTWNGPLPTGDFREPLPSAFAFRFAIGEGRGRANATKLRIWKESTDVQFSQGFTMCDSLLPYAYYAWDDDGRVVTAGSCPRSRCSVPSELNETPLMTQEIDVLRLRLPGGVLQQGWVMMTFLGSNGVLAAVPGGYDDPCANSDALQAWLEVVYETASGDRSVQRATALGNFLCETLDPEDCAKRTTRRSGPPLFY